MTSAGLHPGGASTPVVHGLLWLTSRSGSEDRLLQTKLAPNAIYTWSVGDVPTWEAAVALGLRRVPCTDNVAKSLSSLLALGLSLGDEQQLIRVCCTAQGC